MRKHNQKLKKRWIPGLLLAGLLVLSGCAQEEDTTVSVVSTEAPAITAPATEAETIEIETASKAPEKETPAETEKPEKNIRYLAIGDVPTPWRQSVNEAALRDARSGIVDLYDSVWAVEKIRGMVERYEFPQGTNLNSEPITEEAKAAILNNRSLETIRGEVQYGVLCESTNLRSFPTDDYTTDDIDGFDLFQETRLCAGDVVVVLHESSDRSWAFVQSKSYAGWIHKGDVAFCDKEVAWSYESLQRFVVSTVPVQQVVRGEAYSGVLRLGQRIPLEPTGRGIFVCRSPYEADAYLTLWEKGMRLWDVDDPKRPIEDGEGLWVSFVDIDDISMCVGYLDPAEETHWPVHTMLEQIVPGDEIPEVEYSWGDLYEQGYDCSSFVQSLYRCFGVWIPRNTSALPYGGGQVTELAELSPEEVEALVRSAPNGSLYLVNGHVMMITRDEDGIWFFHETTRYLDAQGVRHEPRGLVKTPIDICGTDGVPYLAKGRYLIIYRE